MAPIDSSRSEDRPGLVNLSLHPMCENVSMLLHFPYFFLFIQLFLSVLPGQMQ
jgi:hypothetical protein